MKATVFAIAACMLALPAAAQQRDQQPRGQETAQTVNLPSGGIVLDFKEIDRNNDRVISVEEWNDFIATLRSRTAERGGTGGAAAGATGSSPEGKR